MKEHPPRHAIITSEHHPSVERIRALRHRSERERSNLFVAEGIRFLMRAVEDRAEIHTLLISPPLLTNRFARSLVERLRRAGTPLVAVTPSVFRSVTAQDPPQGVALVARRRWQRLARMQPDHGLCWLAVDRVQSPGNLGSIIRTCDAAGAAGLIVLNPDTDPFDPAVVRATMGAIFSQRLVRATPAQFVAWKARHGCFLVGTSPAAETDYHAPVYPRLTALLLGWERQGLSPELLRLCDLIVRIPMAGRSDSLNVAVAAGVMLYELVNQRRTV